MENKKPSLLSLNQWIWRSFWRVAVVPLFIIELVFILIYFSANSFSNGLMIDYATRESHEEIQAIASSEAESIQSKLASITHYTDYFRMITTDAHSSGATLSADLASRMTMSDYGAYYTIQDSESKGAAVFYSGAYFVHEAEKAKLGQLMVIEDDMIKLLNSEPLITQLYYNTFDSLNIIYPYFDVINQYPVKMDIPDYNFYYEADLEHNPTRSVVWTDVYLDPAGQGWMASAIAPVYTNDFLEGVVGIDVTVKTFAQNILNMDVPYHGYAMLVATDGIILALPPLGEEDWGLTEYTDHTYDRAVLEDTYKPDNFNLYLAMTDEAAKAEVQNSDSGLLTTSIHGEEHTIAWSTIKETGWKLVLMIEPQEISTQITSIEDELFKIGYFILGGMVVFYVIFFLFMAERARKMSEFISEPLASLNDVFGEIGRGNYKVKPRDTHVLEIEETQNHVIDMGRKLSDATKALMRSEERFNLALEGAETGLWDYNILTKETYFSPKMKQILGYKDNELKASLEIWMSIVHPDDQSQLDAMITQMIHGEKQRIQIDVRVKTRDDHYIWNSVRGGIILDTNNRPVRIVGTNSDITEIIAQRSQNEQLLSDLSQKESDFNVLKEESTKDPLTSVYNRRYLKEFKFDDSDKYAVAMLDLDHFKKINDTYGHVIGDDLLKHTVEIMQQSIRSSDIIVRVGGEEFLIIFKNSTLKGAQAVCEKLRENIMNTPLKTVGVQTISIGLTNVKANEDMETVSQRADSALYEAKRNGRNQVVTKR